MPCYDKKVTIQLLPEPLPALPSVHEPYSLICREGRQVVDRPNNTIKVPVDVSGCRRVAVGIQPLEYIRKYNRAEKIRVTVDIDSRRAVTHYYSAEQIKWCEGELLTDGIVLFQMEGVIDILFEPVSNEPISQPSYRFKLLYSKKAEYEGKTSMCRLSMFRANRSSYAKALWLLANDPHSGMNRRLSKDKANELKGEGSCRSNDNRREKSVKADEGQMRGGKRKIDFTNKVIDQPTDAKDHRMRLIKENQDLEEEIMRLKLMKEQKKLKLELMQLQDEVGSDDEIKQWEEEKGQGKNSIGRGERSRGEPTLLMSPPSTIGSSIPSMDQLRDRLMAEENSW